jgi:hypothetical protein
MSSVRNSRSPREPSSPEDLDPQAVLLCVLDQLDGLRDDRLAGGVDLVFDVSIAGRHNEVDPIDATVQGEIDVVLDAAGETRHPGVEAEFGNAGDRLALARPGTGASGLDDGDVRLVERQGDFGLLVGR